MVGFNGRVCVEGQLLSPVMTVGVLGWGTALLAAVAAWKG